MEFPLIFCLFYAFCYINGFILEVSTHKIAPKDAHSSEILVGLCYMEKRILSMMRLISKFLQSRVRPTSPLVEIVDCLSESI